MLFVCTLPAFFLSNRRLGTFMLARHPFAKNLLSCHSIHLCAIPQQRFWFLVLADILTVPHQTIEVFCKVLRFWAFPVNNLRPHLQTPPPTHTHAHTHTTHTHTQHTHTHKHTHTHSFVQSGRVYGVDTETDPKAPRLIKMLEPEQMDSLNLSHPHTSHCLPSGEIMVRWWWLSYTWSIILTLNHTIELSHPQTSHCLPSGEIMVSRLLDTFMFCSDTER